MLVKIKLKETEQISFIYFKLQMVLNGNRSNIHKDILHEATLWHEDTFEGHFCTRVKRKKNNNKRKINTD